MMTLSGSNLSVGKTSRELGEHEAEDRTRGDEGRGESGRGSKTQVQNLWGRKAIGDCRCQSLGVTEGTAV